MKLNSKAFSAVEALLIVVIVAIVGGTGYYVYHANKTANKTLSTAAKDASGSPKFSSKKTATTTLQTYHDKVGRFTVQYPKDATVSLDSQNTTDTTAATITFADKAELTLTSNLGGRGIANNCSYDEATGKTTWDDPANGSGKCPYLVIEAAKQLAATGPDDKGVTQHVYLEDRSFTSYNDSGTASVRRASCLTLGLESKVGAKQYGLTFVDPEISTYKPDKSLDKFIHACTPIDQNSSTDYFKEPGIVEAKAVLATLKFDN